MDVCIYYMYMLQYTTCTCTSISILHVHASVYYLYMSLDQVYTCTHPGRALCVLIGNHPSTSIIICIYRSAIISTYYDADGFQFCSCEVSETVPYQLRLVCKIVLADLFKH